MPQNHNDRPSIAAIQAALTFMPPNDRGLWLKVGMALKVELGDTGFDLFDSWSQNAENYDLAAVKSSWKSFKTGGKISIGTLIFEATQRGFKLKDHAPAASITAEEAARIKQEREQRLAADQAEIERKQAAAASIAVTAWDKASEGGQSAYLEKKRISGHGVRFAGNKAGAVLLVPVRDDSGKLWNIQRVFANGDKRFYTGGRVSGCFHALGDLAASDWLLIAEGYATGATLFEATGYAVAVAFSESNIKHIAAIMRARYPDKHILICADDDSQTEQKTGKNPGIVAATEAAKTTKAAWCRPLSLNKEVNDFNDLMQLSGIEEVKKQIGASVISINKIKKEIAELIATAKQAAPAQLPAISTPLATSETSENAAPVNQSSVQAAIVEPVKAGKVNPENTPVKPRLSNAQKAAGAGQSSKPFFTVNDSGVFFHAFHEGEPLPALKICSSLSVIAKTRDSTNGEWGYLLEFSDPDGHKKRWSMPAKMLAGDGTQYRSDLLSMGLMIEAGLKVKNHLTTYIQTADVPERVRCVDRIGWHDDVYVLPDRTIGTGDEQVLFQAAGGTSSPFKQRGTLEEWQTHVAAHCRGNSRMQFFISAAFASTLLHHAGVPSGGFHIWGDSSTGKSTAVIVAGSVFGGADYKKSWRATDNALEPTAQQYSDALLILDELAQADPKTVGNVVYMLGNEAGKGRATQNATAKRIATWRLLFISDGEIPLATHMAEAGKATKGGHDVRMAHISADAGKGLGVYETVHGFDGGAAMSDHLVKAAHQYYGTAGLAFIEWAVSQSTGLRALMAKELNDKLQEICPKDAHGQVSRVATRFALVGLAGELATLAGITSWENGEATEAAATCFNDWLASRGGAGNIEHDRMLALLPNFILRNQDKFDWWGRAVDERKPSNLSKMGLRRLVDAYGKPMAAKTSYRRDEASDIYHDVIEDEALTEYYIFADTFKTEICKGYDSKAIAALMVKHGGIIPAKDGKATRSERLPGLGNIRCYKIAPTIMSLTGT